MSTVRCMYCGRFYYNEKFDKKCKECERQFREVMRKVGKKYEGTLKMFGDK